MATTQGDREGSIDLVEESRAIEAIQRRIDAVLAELNYAEQARFGIRLSLEEAIMNGFHHGNQKDPRKSLTVRWVVTPEVATFHVTDQGEGFDPDAIPDPTLDENLEIPSGRGIMLIRTYMSGATYHAPGNHIEMHYRKPPRS
ncbi:MAG: ATP-binding protein [Phycisphaerales bacterium]|nr:ATP-binding protein [Phycisphaerales bacterium]